MANGIVQLSSKSFIYTLITKHTQFSLLIRVGKAENEINTEVQNKLRMCLQMCNRTSLSSVIMQTFGREVRASTIRNWKEDSTTKTGRSNFIIDTARLWNQVPPNIKSTKSLSQAKSAIKLYCSSLPTEP